MVLMIPCLCLSYLWPDPIPLESLPSTEVFKVVGEVGQTPGPVDLLAGGAVGLGNRPGTAAEDTDLAHLVEKRGNLR